MALVTRMTDHLKSYNEIQFLCLLGFIVMKGIEAEAATSCPSGRLVINDYWGITNYA